MKPENKSTNEEFSKETFLNRFYNLYENGRKQKKAPQNYIDYFEARNFLFNEVSQAEEKGYQRGRKEKYKASKAYNQGYQRGRKEERENQRLRKEYDKDWD